MADIFVLAFIIHFKFLSMKIAKYIWKNFLHI